MPTVILHIDHEGYPTLHVAGDPVTVLWVDERVPHDRVYQITERCAPDRLAEIIGDSDVGHAGDGRNDNLAQAIAARLRPGLRVVSEEFGEGSPLPASKGESKS